MAYQILQQREPGEKWEFLAHGARYADKREVQAALDLIHARGWKSRVIPCGKERKRPGTARLVLNTTRRCYWRTGAGVYLSEAPNVQAWEIARRTGGYARLDELMRLRGERSDLIARICTPDGHAKESGQ